MSISPLERLTLVLGLIFGVPASIATIFYFLGVYGTLKFAWLAACTPYVYSLIAFTVILWLAAFVMDYKAVRSAAFAKPATVSAPVDPAPLIEAEERKRIDAIRAEGENRSKAISMMSDALYKHIGEINVILTEMRTPKPEPTLKERTTQLANELYALLKQQGPEPPHPLSDKTGTIEGQEKTFKAFFDWQRDTYYKYMAFFRERVVKIDYELAASGIFTKLNDDEIDPPKNNTKLDLEKIAHTLLVTANRM